LPDCVGDGSTVELAEGWSRAFHSDSTSGFIIRSS